MTNLPQVRERISAADFQTVAKFLPKTELGGTLAVSENEKAVVMRGGRVVDMFSGRSGRTQTDAEVVVASLRHYHMVFGFGDCSRSPYNRAPAMIHLPNLPEIEASNGEILRSMTAAIRFSLIRDDRSNVEKLLALNAARRDAVTVQDLANGLALQTAIGFAFAGVAASGAESVRFDKPYIDAVRRQILTAANMALGEYGISASAATLDIYATSRDAPRRLTESQKEELAKHNSRMSQLDAQIEAEKRRIELENLSNQREMLRTATMKHLEEQAEIQVRIESLDPRPLAAASGYAGSRSASAPVNHLAFWMHYDDAEITLHKGDCAYVSHFASPPKWKEYPTERLARNATILPIRGCQSCNPLPGDPSVESLFIGDAIREGFTQRVFELISSGADINHKDENGYTPLHAAAAFDKTEIAQALITAGSDPNSKAELGITPLHTTAEYSKTEIAQALIAAGAYIHAKNDDGNTPLHISAASGHTKMAQALISAGADIHAKNENGNIPLHDAARNGRSETAQALIDAGGSIYARNRDQDTPLHLASSNGHTQTAQALIDAGADINAWGSDGMPLQVAAGNGHTETALALITAGTDPNAHDGIGDDTSLHRAAGSGHTTIAQALIDAGADINAINTVNGDTPLHCAASSGHTVTVQMLIDAGADIDAKDGFVSTPLYRETSSGRIAISRAKVVRALKDARAYLAKDEAFGDTPLHCAARNGHIETVQALIDAGADINAKVQFGDTLLCRAARNGHTEMAQALIDAGADPNAKGLFGDTPLQGARKNDHTETAQALIDAGADLNAKNEVSNDALLYTMVQSGRTEFVRALINTGADLNAKKEDGDTPLHCAARNGHVEIAQALIDAGADLNAKKEDGDTPLHVAAYSGETEITQALIDAGADLNAKEEVGLTPLYIAEIFGHTETKQALIDAGAFRFQKPWVGQIDGRMSKRA